MGKRVHQKTVQLDLQSKEEEERYRNKDETMHILDRREGAVER
jgi:hypothetical protein